MLGSSFRTARSLGIQGICDEIRAGEWSGVAVRWCVSGGIQKVVSTERPRALECRLGLKLVRPPSVNVGYMRP